MFVDFLNHYLLSVCSLESTCLFVCLFDRCLFVYFFKVWRGLCDIFERGRCKGGTRITKQKIHTFSKALHLWGTSLNRLTSNKDYIRRSTLKKSVDSRYSDETFHQNCYNNWIAHKHVTTNCRLPGLQKFIRPSYVYCILRHILTLKLTGNSKQWEFLHLVHCNFSRVFILEKNKSTAGHINTSLTNHASIIA